MTGTIDHEPTHTAAVRRGGPLIVTEDTELLDDLLRLCAAAGATPEVHHSVPSARPETPSPLTSRPPAPPPGPGTAPGGWEAAPLVLVGDDAARRVRGAARRRGVVLVSRDQDDPGVWQRAVEIGADHVLLLPDGEQWLVDRIADVAEGVG
ncbi:hypothetical protein R2F25_17405 [Streptomyces sp. UP1A-1]|nr:hypothetical protein [Streptomyces sp. UP1A-1]